MTVPLVGQVNINKKCVNFTVPPSSLYFQFILLVGFIIILFILFYFYSFFYNDQHKIIFSYLYPQVSFLSPSTNNCSVIMQLASVLASFL